MYEDFWQAPERLWRKQLDEAEMDAITVRVSAAALGDSNAVDPNDESP